MKRIASVAVMAGDRLLIGKRSDDQRWNLPGGHVDEGETPEEGAARELKEETGISIDPERLLSLREPQKVTTFTGKEIEVYSYLVVLPDTCETKREGTDPGEAHDWSWTNVANGLPAEIAQTWHNQTDATMEALGLQVCTNNALHKNSDELLIKKWPTHYERVKGQTSDKGVSSKKQYRYMQAMAAEGDKDAKAYLAHSSKAGLPENGKGRESDKRKKKDKAEKGERKLDTYDEHREAESIKRANRPKIVTFGDAISDIKAKYGEKKPKTFNQEVTDIKARYKKPMEKSSDLFYAKIEGLLMKGFQNQELISHLMDAELLARSSEDLAGHDSIMSAAERLFDAAMSKEEQTVYELSYMAKSGCEESEMVLAKFAQEMYAELVKHSTVEDAVSEMVKAAASKHVKTPLKDMIDEHKKLVNVLRSPSHEDDKEEAKEQEKELKEYKDKAKKSEGKYSELLEEDEIAEMEDGIDKGEEKYNPVPEVCTSCKVGKPKLKGHTSEAGMHLTWWDCPHCETTGISEPKMEKSADNSRVKGKANGASYRMVHGYRRYTSGPKRGQYVHRDEAEKRLGRKLKTTEHVDHKSGNRGDNKNTKVMSASAHAAKTNKTRAGKGYSGSKRYEHSRD